MKWSEEETLSEVKDIIFSFKKEYSIGRGYEERETHERIREKAVEEE